VPSGAPNPAPNVGYATGDRVPGAPEENASAGLQYNFSLSNTWNGYARADYSYAGDVHFIFGTGAASTPYPQGGFGQANLRLQLQHQQFGFEVFARNLTDKRAAEATGDPTQGGYVYMLRPREPLADFSCDYQDLLFSPAGPKT
jgi:hypothetical protein